MNDYFRDVFNEWCVVQQAVGTSIDTIKEMVHKYIQVSESSNHIYTMALILHKKVIFLHFNIFKIDLNSQSCFFKTNFYSVFVLTLPLLSDS